MKIISALVAASMTVASMAAETTNKEVQISIVETTDVHGNFFPYDFIKRQPGEGSLSRVATYIDSLRCERGADNIILLDCGDILQGQPSAYYYNFIDTVTPHLVADIYDFMGYDAATIGNHDIETGHQVYDRLIRQTNTPVIGANIISTSTGEPYLLPYKVIHRQGIKIAILGLITPSIPSWLPENVWSGMRFDDMVESARKWEQIIRERENPDLLVGLFHAGRDYERTTDGMMENASLWIGMQVPGFDVIFFGHDHLPYNEEVTNAKGSTLMLNPTNNARNVAVADLTFDIDSNGKATLRSKKGRIVAMDTLQPSPRFLTHFNKAFEDVNRFVDRIVGEAADTMSTRHAFFGPSTFMQLIHELQLSISGADISMAAPLSFDAIIHKGPMRISDMFTLYKYENLLYTMRLTGLEIKNYLEMAYSLWCNQVSPDGGNNAHLLLFASENPTPQDNRLKNPSYNFDSAFGIDYTVDITKPKGEKITITGLSDGRPFNLDDYYTVAVNSYRGNGGSDIMTVGAGIPYRELSSRIVRATDLDLRYYLLKEVERRKTIHPNLTHNWRFVPEQLATALAERDNALLFGDGASKEQK